MDKESAAIGLFAIAFVVGLFGTILGIALEKKWLLGTGIVILTGVGITYIGLLLIALKECIEALLK